MTHYISVGSSCNQEGDNLFLFVDLMAVLWFLERKFLFLFTNVVAIYWVWKVHVEFCKQKKKNLLKFDWFQFNIIQVKKPSQLVQQSKSRFSIHEPHICERKKTNNITSYSMTICLSRVKFSQYHGNDLLFNILPFFFSFISSISNMYIFCFLWRMTV